MVDQLSVAEKVAQYLLQIKAVVLSPENPFTWASGWKSPIYCDNRLILSHPQIRDEIRNFLVDLIREKYPEAQGISGVATGGIAQAALIADQLNLPMTYVRSKPKGHGRQNQVEGHFNQADKIVVIEDLVSTGGSSMAAVDALRNEGANPIGLISVFSYGFEKAVDCFAEGKIAFDSLSEYVTLVDVAKNLGYIEQETIKTLSDWRQAPGQWTS